MKNTNELEIDGSTNLVARGRRSFNLSDIDNLALPLHFGHLSEQVFSIQQAGHAEHSSRFFNWYIMWRSMIGGLLQLVRLYCRRDACSVQGSWVALRL